MKGEPPLPEPQESPRRAPSLMTVAWSIQGLFAVTVALWLPYSPLSVTGAGGIGLAVIELLGLALGVTYLGRRLDGDESRIASGIRFLARGTQHFVHGAIFLLLFSALASVASYLGMTLSLPLSDEALARAGEALGFDWLWSLAWVNSRPVLARVLVLGYHSCTLQTVGVVVVLGFSCQIRNLQEYLALFALTSLCVVTLSSIFPALGAYQHFGPVAEDFSSLTANAGVWHLAHLRELRAGSLHSLVMSEAEGLVSFPSFHAVLAIIITYSLRETRYLAIPVLLVNLGLLVGTVPEGGHYLIDVVIGVLIALGAIALVRRLETTQPASFIPPWACLEAVAEEG